MRKRKKKKSERGCERGNGLQMKIEWMKKDIMKECEKEKEKGEWKWVRKWKLVTKERRWKKGRNKGKSELKRVWMWKKDLNKGGIKEKEE